LVKAQYAFQAIQYSLGVAQCLQSLGNIHCKCLKYEPAKSRLNEVLAAFEVIPNHFGAAQCLHSPAYIHTEMGRFDIAHDNLRKSLQLVALCQDINGQAWIFYRFQSCIAVRVTFFKQQNVTQEQEVFLKALICL